MKIYLTIISTLFVLLFTNCAEPQDTRYCLSPTDFAAKINELPTAPIIDVRAPKEYAEGHIPNAKNYNWNGDDFEKQISTLDKSKPIFVYCLSGGRSTKAAGKMRKEGFTEVYQLNGGITKWKEANLPLQ